MCGHSSANGAAMQDENAASLEENYRRAYGTRVGFGKRPALILVDFVQAYFDPASDLFAGRGCRIGLGAAGARGGAYGRYSGGADPCQLPRRRAGWRALFRKGQAAAQFPAGLGDRWVAARTLAARGRAGDIKAISERVLRHVAGVHADRGADRQRDPDRADHERLRARDLRGFDVSRLYHRGGARGVRRSPTPRRTRRTCST